MATSKAPSRSMRGAFIRLPCTLLFAKAGTVIPTLEAEASSCWNSCSFTRNLICRFSFLVSLTLFSPLPNTPYPVVFSLVQNSRCFSSFEPRFLFGRLPQSFQNNLVIYPLYYFLFGRTTSNRLLELKQARTLVPNIPLLRGAALPSNSPKTCPPSSVLSTEDGTDFFSDLLLANGKKETRFQRFSLKKLNRFRLSLSPCFPVKMYCFYLEIQVTYFFLPKKIGYRSVNFLFGNALFSVFLLINNNFNAYFFF